MRSASSAPQAKTSSSKRAGGPPAGVTVTPPWSRSTRSTRMPETWPPGGMVGAAGRWQRQQQGDGSSHAGGSSWSHPCAQWPRCALQWLHRAAAAYGEDKRKSAGQAAGQVLFFCLQGATVAAALPGSALGECKHTWHACQQSLRAVFKESVQERYGWKGGCGAACCPAPRQPSPRAPQLWVEKHSGNDRRRHGGRLVPFSEAGLGCKLKNHSAAAASSRHCTTCGSHPCRKRGLLGGTPSSY